MQVFLKKLLRQEGAQPEFTFKEGQLPEQARGAIGLPQNHAQIAKLHGYYHIFPLYLLKGKPSVEPVLLASRPSGRGCARRSTGWARRRR